jgi:beta-lactamase regulating signal transducer with metallopeptidase domain/protocatechuate 3,4-dioxygenase beta subunit
MTPLHEFGIIVFAQVTVTTFIAALLCAAAHRHATARHTIGTLALLLVLASPVLALTLPRPAWWAVLTSWPHSEQSPALASDSPVPPGRVIDGTIEGTAPLVSDESESHPERLPSTGAAHSAVHQAVLVMNVPTPAGVEHPATSSHAKTWLARSLNVAGGLWAIGIVILGCRAMWSQRQLRRLRISIEASSTDAASQMPGLRDAFESVCRSFGIVERPALAVSDISPLPMLLGLRRLVIVMPSDLATNASPERLRDVLVHECAHIYRNDPWRNLVQQVAAVLFWVHPGVHWLNHQLARAREESCDNFVLKNADRAEYAQLLLELAEQCAAWRLKFRTLGILGSRWTLENRIAGLLDPKRPTALHPKPTHVVLIALLLGSVTVAVGGVGAPARPEQGAPEVPSGATNPTDSTKKLSIHGTCHDPDGKPISNASVRIFQSQSFERPILRAETRTDVDGRYAFRDVEYSADSSRLCVAATAKGYVSYVQHVKATNGEIDLPFELSSDPGTLSGVVTGPDGRPVKDALVYLNCLGIDPLPGIFGSVTDNQGRYAITDLKRWLPADTKKADQKNGIMTMTTRCSFFVEHPDYPRTTAWNSAVPQTVNITLKPPAVVEGRVIDSVTQKPVANAVVSAQGVVQSGWFQTRSDRDGRYRLAMTKDHYNIWADVNDRMPLAVKAIAAEPGKTVSGADIRLVKGGFVVGTVLDAATGKPMTPGRDNPIYVAHYGPARPRTGAAVTNTPINADGTYRLRVAPGRNFVYLMSDANSSAYVNVEDGREAKLDLTLSNSRPRRNNPSEVDPDVELATELRDQWAAEEAIERILPGGRSGQAVAISSPRKRRDTPTGKLLDELEKHNRRSRAFTDLWCRTLKGIVDIGPAAIPELVEELDATNDGRMLGCLGFMVRAIGDKRAIPGLIRAIPKTLRTPSSDMGLEGSDATLVKFMQENSIDKAYKNALFTQATQYSFGRPVREIFGALEGLSGQTFDEVQLYSVFSGGIASQQRLKRKLFERTASQWASWWEQHHAEYVQDAAYFHVNLVAAKVDGGALTGLQPGMHFKTGAGGAGHVLQPVVEPEAIVVFHDLDTGRTVPLPQKWRNAKSIESQLDEIVAWAASEGFDLMGTVYVSPHDQQSWFAIRPIGLRAWELGEERWKMSSSDITLEALQAEGTPARDLLLHVDRASGSYDPQATATFLFTTREGTPGLLFVGVAVKDTNVKIGERATGDDERKTSHFFKGRRFAWTTLEENAGGKPAE